MYVPPSLLKSQNATSSWGGTRKLTYAFTREGIGMLSSVLGSGIPRVMASGSDVELIDRPDGNQFIARIWRTTQKDDSTTQKANENLIDTTQKDEATTQKPLNTTQKRILEYLKNYPKATRQDVAEALGDITADGVKFNIGLLQRYGALKRVNGRKNGEWEVNPLYLK